MLLKEIKQLNENSLLSNEVITFIRKHCQPYLHEVGDNLSNFDATKFMYRGVSSNAIKSAKSTGLPGAYITPGHYNERYPRDSSLRVHNLANNFLREKFGIPFRDGVFTTANVTQASGYGHEIVIIIPIGNFKFCWSSKISDMFSISPGFGSVDEKAFLEKLETYQTTDLPAALESRKEIMLYCDNCLMIQTGRKSRSSEPEKPDQSDHEGFDDGDRY